MNIAALNRFAAFAAVATAAGCAAPPPPPPPSHTPTIDGVYQGSANGSCGAAVATVTVHDGRFTLRLQDGQTLAGTVDSHGSLTADAITPSGNNLSFSGHVDGPDLRGGSYNGRCAYAFSMTRQPQASPAPR